MTELTIDPETTGLDAETIIGMRDAGTVHVITAATVTRGVGDIAAHEGADASAGTALDIGAGSALADGLAVRVVDRRSVHQVAVPSDRDHETAVIPLRYLPAAALSNPRANLAVVLPDDWNAMTGGLPGYSANGLENEVNTVEALGHKIRHRLFVHHSPATAGVHFGSLAERLNVPPVARDVLRAGGHVQIEAGAGDALDALASVGIPPWAGWVEHLYLTIVVPCGGVNTRIGAAAGDRDANEVAQLASEAVRRAGGPVFRGSIARDFPDTVALALVEAEKLVPGVAGWTAMAMDDQVSESEPAKELGALVEAVQNACDGEVDVELVGTGPGTVIDLR
jgi:hypothetical protein